MSRKCWTWCGIVNDEGFIPSLVEENQPGHVPAFDQECRSWLKRNATLNEVLAACDRENLKLGLSQADVEAIISSSLQLS